MGWNDLLRSFTVLALCWAGAEKMLQEARAKALQAGLVPEFRRMDCHRLDFADNTFDAVISRNLTHTLRDHKQVYKEWLRVLKPGGTLLIFDANWHLTECDEKLRAESRFQRRKNSERNLRVLMNSTLNLTLTSGRRLKRRLIQMKKLL